jgi:hypothetical protein
LHTRSLRISHQVSLHPGGIPKAETGPQNCPSTLTSEKWIDIQEKLRQSYEALDHSLLGNTHPFFSKWRKSISKYIIFENIPCQMVVMH